MVRRIVTLQLHDEEPMKNIGDPITSGKLVSIARTTKTDFTR
jgi:hypothetical protein